MKLLFDQNLSFKLCTLVEAAFPGAKQARIVGLDRADDAALWAYAAENGFVLVTKDADFAEMAALRGPPPKVIWLRSGNSPTATIAATLAHCADVIEAFLMDETASCLELY